MNESAVPLTNVPKGAKNSGICQEYQMNPIIRLELKAEYLFCNSGNKSPRHPSSSPSGPANNADHNNPGIAEMAVRSTVPIFPTNK